MYKFQTYDLKKKKKRPGAKGGNLHEGNLAKSVNCAKASWAVGGMASERQCPATLGIDRTGFENVNACCLLFPRENTGQRFVNPQETKQVLMEEDLLQ